MEHCLLLVFGSCTGGLGHRFLRPGQRWEDSVKERALKAYPGIGLGGIITFQTLKIQYIHLSAQ